MKERLTGGKSFSLEVHFKCDTKGNNARLKEERRYLKLVTKVTGHPQYQAHKEMWLAQGPAVLAGPYIKLKQ